MNPLDRRQFVGMGGRLAAAVGVLSAFQACSGSDVDDAAAAADVPRPAGFLRSSWGADRFALGSYSFLPVGSTPDDRLALAEPVAGVIFFAGEATSTEHPATVHGALASGERAADEVLSVLADGETVVVIGAGAAGLGAAQRLRDHGITTVVIEARDRIGGRISTVTDPAWRIPIELGASWVHDVDASDLAARLQAAGAATHPFDYDDSASTVAGDVDEVEQAIDEALDWAENRADDISLENSLVRTGAYDAYGPELVAHYLSVEIAAEYGAAPDELSTWWGTAEGSVGDDLLVAGGYVRMLEAMADGLDVRLGNEVVQIDWSDVGATLTIANHDSVVAGRLIVTLPLGVLKQAKPAFVPALPDDHVAAVDRLGFGLLDKLWLRFETPFWSRDQLMWQRLATADAPFDVWFNLEPLVGEPVLLALIGGDNARRWAQRNDDEWLAAALRSLGEFAAAGW